MSETRSIGRATRVLPTGKASAEPRGRTRRGLLLAVAVALFTAVFSASLLQPAELVAQDLLSARRPARRTEQKIVIVGITDGTLQAWTEPEFLWGLRFRKLIERLQGAGTRFTRIMHETFTKPRII